MLHWAKPYACTGDRVCTPRINTIVLNNDQCCHDYITFINNNAELDAQRYRALMMILQSHKTQIMICEMPTLCHIPCASKTYQILSPLLFQESPLPFNSLNYYLLVYMYMRYPNECVYTYINSLLGLLCEPQQSGSGTGG